MAAKSLTTKAIALTEKKMDMTLDDIIKMSYNNAVKWPMKQRNSNRSQKNSSSFVHDKSPRMRRVMDVKSALRQGALAQKRSSFQANSFPLATHSARKAAVAPIWNGPVNKFMMVNKPRPTPVQRRAVSGSGFGEKQQQQQHQRQMKSVVPKQQLQTLDSRFASMKTQRTVDMVTTIKSKNNGARRKASGGERLWKRAPRFGN